MLNSQTDKKWLQRNLVPGFQKLFTNDKNAVSIIGYIATYSVY